VLPLFGEVVYQVALDKYFLEEGRSVEESHVDEPGSGNEEEKE
jgi:hypothetical protein